VQKTLKLEQPRLRHLVAAPTIRDVQSADWSRWYARHKGPRRNIVSYDSSGRNGCVIANSHAGKDYRRSTDPYVSTKTDGCNPGWTQRLQGMVVRIENGHQVSNQAIVANYDAMIRYDRGTSVDKDALAEHKRSVRCGAHFDWYRLTA
jgi:hypothetical protein